MKTANRTHRIQAVIFDFDGLLLDTETPAYQSWQRVYAEYGQELPIELWQHALGTSHGFNALTHLQTQLGDRWPGDEVYARRQQLKYELSALNELLPGARTILAEAAALGLPCAVASSSDRAWIMGRLERHSITGAFTCVRTADDVTHTKPNPELFLSAAACLGVPPSACLVFEDSPNRIRAAHAAGMRCVAVPGAISSLLVLPEADLVLTQLDSLPLAEIVRAVTGATKEAGDVIDA